MGQHYDTALAANDWNLFLDDAMDDLMAIWDSRDLCRQGASEQDRQMAREMLRRCYDEWDGTVPTEAQEDAYANRYAVRVSMGVDEDRSA